MNCDDVGELLDLFVLGALSRHEVEDVETHLESCPNCRTEIGRAWQAGQLLRLAVPTLEPPDSLRYRILAAARADLEPARAAVPAAPVQQRGSWRDWFSWLSAPRFAGAIAIVPLVLSLWLTTQVLSMRGEVQATQQALVKTTQNGVVAASILGKVVESPITSANVPAVTQLVGAPGAPDSWGKLYYFPNSNEGVLVVAGLPKQSDDKVYQLWLQSGGRVNPAGTFYCEETGRGMLVLPDGISLQTVEMLRVTKEQRGGSDQPHEPNYMWGRLRST